MIAYFIQSHPSNIKYTLVVFPKAPGGVQCQPAGRRRRGPEAPLRPGATAPPVTAAAGVPRTNVSAALPLSNQKIAVVHIHFT